MPTRMALEKLRRDLLTMGEMCEHAVASALMALIDRDPDLACYVIDYDSEIDEMELSVDRDCLDLMQGCMLSGTDLRFVAAAAKINNDLERVGDLASGICNHVLFLVRERSVLTHIIDFQDLLEQTGLMMRESIQALLEMDTQLAWKIIDEQQIVDDEAHVIFRETLDIMKRDPRTIERCCHILAIQQLLHRVADQAANVAEEVIFMEEGVVVRHHIHEFHPVTPKPFGDVAPQEQERMEGEIIRSKKTREQIRQEHAEAKRQARTLTPEKVTAAAATAAPKADKARKERSGRHLGKQSGE